MPPPLLRVKRRRLESPPSILRVCARRRLNSDASVFFRRLSTPPTTPHAPLVDVVHTPAQLSPQPDDVFDYFKLTRSRRAYIARVHLLPVIHEHQLPVEVFDQYYDADAEAEAEADADGNDDGNDDDDEASFSSTHSSDPDAQSVDYPSTPERSCSSSTSSKSSSGSCSSSSSGCSSSRSSSCSLPTRLARLRCLARAQKPHNQN